MLIEPQWIVLGGGAVLVGGGVLVAQAAARKRREALEAFCLMRGFRFEPERRGAEVPLAALAEQFRSGVAGGGKSSHRHCIHGLLWETAASRLPAFTLGPEHFLWWRSGRLPKPDQMEQFLMEGDAVARRFLKE